MRQSAISLSILFTVNIVRYHCRLLSLSISALSLSTQSILAYASAHLKFPSWYKPTAWRMSVITAMVGFTKQNWSVAWNRQRSTNYSVKINQITNQVNHLIRSNQSNNQSNNKSSQSLNKNTKKIFTLAHHADGFLRE